MMLWPRAVSRPVPSSVRRKRFCSVRKKPGAMALTRMRGEYSVARCTASHCVKLLTPAFAAEYERTRVKGRTALIEETFRTTPSPRSAIRRPKTWLGKIVPSRFRSKTKRSASSGMSKNERSGRVVACGWLPPAPLTRQSTRPNSATISRAARSRSSRRVASPEKATARPGPSISERTASAFSRLRASTATSAPQPTSARTITRPRTPVPPVTTAVRPLKSYIFVSSAKFILRPSSLGGWLNVTPPNSFTDEQRSDVALVEVLRHVARDRRLARFEHLQITLAHLGRDLVADVQQLPQARVVAPVARVVAEGAGELLRRPALHLRLRGELRAVDVDHRRVRGAQGVNVFERVGVNLFGEREPFAAR